MGEGVVAYSTDDKPQFSYEPFNEGRDFGPLDIARTVMYCRWVEALSTAHSTAVALVHVVSDTSPRDRANTVALCGAYLVLTSGASAEDAFRPFTDEPLPPFVDCRGEAAAGSDIGDGDDPEFELSIFDCLRGLVFARDSGWLDFRTFNVEDHSAMLRPEHGDMSWLLPNKALAMASPWAEPHDQDGLPVCTPALLTPYLLKQGVRLVVQCNNPEREEEGERRRLLSYDAKSFEELGIRHVKLPFEDGGCPSVDLILDFLKLVETERGGFVVHCRSGLGRTATLIAAYAMQNLGFDARSFIGWARAMRPGTVHGSQQQYLVNLEPHLRPGSMRPLASLDYRERLMLLPRRELRFWALDCGIPATRTGQLTVPELVELVMAAHGHQVLPQPATVQPKAGPAAAARAPSPAATRPVAASTKEAFSPPSTGNTLPVNASAAAPGPSRTAVALQALLSVASRSTSAVATAPAAQLSAVEDERPARLESGWTLNASAEKARSATGPGTAGSATSPSAIHSDISAVNRALGIGVASVVGGPIVSGSIGSAKTKMTATALDDWEDLLRYLNLLSALQSGKVNDGASLDQPNGASWNAVRSIVERLRDHCKGRAPESTLGASLGNSKNAVNHICDRSAQEQAVQKARDSREVAAREADQAEVELQDARQQATVMLRRCGQLRMRLAREREESASGRKRIEAFPGELQGDGDKLTRAIHEVEELRARAMRQGGLEQWQVEHVETLRRGIAEARETTSHYGRKCVELRTKLEIAKESHQQKLQADSLSIINNRPDPESTELSWDDVRSSLHRLRDQSHPFMQEATAARPTAWVT